MKETICSRPLSLKLTATRQSFGARTYELKKRGGDKRTPVGIDKAIATIRTTKVFCEGSKGVDQDFIRV